MTKGVARCLRRARVKQNEVRPQLHRTSESLRSGMGFGDPESIGSKVLSIAAALLFVNHQHQRGGRAFCDVMGMAGDSGVNEAGYFIAW